MLAHSFAERAPIRLLTRGTTVASLCSERPFHRQDVEAPLIERNVNANDRPRLDLHPPNYDRPTPKPKGLC